MNSTTTRVVAGLAGLGALLALTACNVKAGDDGTSTKPKSPGVSKGLAGKDATADVKLVSCGTYDSTGMGFVQPKLTITNHSTKRSDYYVELGFYDAKGTQLGTANDLVDSVEAGKSATSSATGQADGKWKTCKLLTVQRTASV